MRDKTRLIILLTVANVLGGIMAIGGERALEFAGTVRAHEERIVAAEQQAALATRNMQSLYQILVQSGAIPTGAGSASTSVESDDSE